MKPAPTLYIFIFLLVNVLHSCKSRQVIEPFSPDKIYYYAIQEDVLKIVTGLDTISEDSLTEDQLKLKTKYLVRFKYLNEQRDSTQKDSLITGSLNILHKYWSDVLLKKLSLKEAENKYGKQLADFIITYRLKNKLKPVKISNNEEAIKAFRNVLKQKGYLSRIDRTGNLLDANIWTSQTSEKYTIKLTDTTIEIPVVFIDNTITMGWEEYATFGHFYPGGWASSDTLYCVKKGYHINTENFRVSYLVHEARHFADSKMYTNYPRWMAEYRAKLATLAISDSTTFSLISNFIKGAKNDQSLTHPYAEYGVINNLSQLIFHETYVTDTARWHKTNSKTINDAASKLLNANSLGLNKKSM